MKKLSKFLCMLLVGVFLFAFFAACSKTASNPSDGGGGGGGNGGNGGNGGGVPSLALTVQNSVVAQFETNAVTVSAENFPAGQEFTYQIAGEDGTYRDAKATADTAYAFLCNELGEFSVRAVAKVNDTTYTSNVGSFTVKAEGGVMFGTSPEGHKPTINIDFSHDDGTADAYLEHKGVDNVSNEYAYVKGVMTDQFMFTTTIDLVGINGGEPYPKAGIFARSGNTIYYLAFDMHVDYSFGDVVLVQCSGIDWYWPGKPVNFNNISFRNGSERVTHSLTMVRDGEYFYCAVDGNWFACYKISGFLAETAIGTFTMAQHAIFSEYGYVLGGTEAYAAALEEASETIKTVTTF